MSIHPTILNLSSPAPPSMTNIVHSAIDLVVPSTVPLTEKEWDLLDEAVLALEGSLGTAGLATGLEKAEVSDKEADTKAKEGDGHGKIVICKFCRTRRGWSCTDAYSRSAPPSSDYRL